MVSLRKASSYSKKKARPFTRKSGQKSHAFIKAVPTSKIVKFTMGDQKSFNEGKHKFVLKLVADEKVQIRDNALEAGRMLINKVLDTDAPGQYFLAVKVYPHHVLRENKLAAGAGADRLSSGMTHSYGQNVGRAAMVGYGKDIFFISALNEKAVKAARKALDMVKAKVPCRTRVVFEKLK